MSRLDGAARLGAQVAVLPHGGGHPSPEPCGNRSAPMPDAAHFSEHIDRTAGHLIWLGCLAAGADASLEAPARAVARAHGLAGWLMAVPVLEARGRLPLPDGRVGAVRALARDGLASLAGARATRFGAAVPVIRMAWRAGPILRQAVRDPGAVAAGQLGTSEFRRRGGLMLRTASGRW